MVPPGFLQNFRGLHPAWLRVFPRNPLGLPLPTSAWRGYVYGAHSLQQLLCGGCIGLFDLEGSCAVSAPKKYKQRNDHENKAVLLLDPKSFVKFLFINQKCISAFGDETESNTNHVFSSRNVPRSSVQFVCFGSHDWGAVAGCAWSCFESRLSNHLARWQLFIDSSLVCIQSLYGIGNLHMD